MDESENQPMYDLEHLLGHREVRRPKYAVKYWPQLEACQRHPRIDAPGPLFVTETDHEDEVVDGFIDPRSGTKIDASTGEVS